MEAESFYENFYNDVRCAVCLALLSRPKTLQCLHSFCAKCAEDLGRHSIGCHHIVCPICRQESRTSRIVDDFRLLGLVELYERQEERMRAKRVLKSCQLCEENTREYFCKKCEKYVCKSCLEAHVKFSDCEEINAETVGSQLEVAVNQLDNMLDELKEVGHGYDLQIDLITEVTSQATDSCCSELEDLEVRDIRRVEEFYKKQHDVILEGHHKKNKSVDDRCEIMVRKVEILQQKIIEAKQNKEKLLGEDAFSLELMNRELLLIRDEEWSPLRYRIQNRAVGALDQNKALTVENDDPSPVVDIEAVAESLGDEELKIPTTAAQKCLETEGYAL